MNGIESVLELETFLAKAKFDEKGLIPAIAQDVTNGCVLMLAYMNEDALRQTLQTKKATYFSRSRQTLWIKGETSGHTQTVHGVYYDCDADTILLKVQQTGAACHTGEASCFFNTLWDDGKTTARGAGAINDDFAIIQSRIQDPKSDSYTNYLLEKGTDKICKKVGEEATEVVIALKNNDKDELVYEAADLVYHLLVAMAHMDVPPEELYAEMQKRR